MEVTERKKVSIILNLYNKNRSDTIKTFKISVLQKYIYLLEIF